jgi:hypothetical protein
MSANFRLVNTWPDYLELITLQLYLHPSSPFLLSLFLALASVVALANFAAPFPTKLVFISFMFLLQSSATKTFYTLYLLHS